MPAPPAGSIALAVYVAAPAGNAWCAQCEAEAIVMVDGRIGTAAVDPLIRWRAVLEVGAELYYRRDAHGGNAGLDGDTATARVPRNPIMIMAAILDGHLGPGFA